MKAAAFHGPPEEPARGDKPMPIFLPCLTLVLSGLATSAHATDHKSPPPLLFENRFMRPEEVVKHYVERDRWGFIWSGMTNEERQALTLWPLAPHPEVAYLVEKIEIGPTQAVADRATIEVIYHVNARTDGRGTRLPLTTSKKRVIYQLERHRGKWRIVTPAAQAIACFVDPKVFPIRLPVSSSRSGASARLAP